MGDRTVLRPEYGWHLGIRWRRRSEWWYGYGLVGTLAVVQRQQWRR